MFMQQNNIEVFTIFVKTKSITICQKLKKELLCYAKL
ncbi:MAG: hypothetical protein H6Q20_834 [Bacteroidetes bacterium]|jgi:hypothetical protein|nr:hypothetical protein [Bacteroidota bacterium]